MDKNVVRKQLSNMEGSSSILSQFPEKKHRVCACNQKITVHGREAMAATGGPTEELCIKGTCPLCLEYCKDPVVLDCGHRFCRGCLTRHWGESGTPASCPHCEEMSLQRNWRPNLQLANAAEKAEEYKGKGTDCEKEMCERHQKPLKFFCREDQARLCWACNSGTEHKGHNVVPVEETAYRDKVTQAASTNSETSEALPTMATNVEEESKCSICKGYLTNLVSVDCGHNYCRSCITNYCEVQEELEEEPQCPLCRAQIQKVNFRPNWQLANIVEKIKILPLKPAKENLCGKHKEKLNLFCTEDREFVCVGCERSPEHRSHTVLLLEEAAQQYKDEMQAPLQSLKRERDTFKCQRVAEEQRREEYLTKLGVEKQKVTTACEQMCKNLQEKQHFWLAQLVALEKEIEESQEEKVTRLSKEISRLSELITEMEEKCQQPTSDLLQGIRSTVSRYQEEPMRQLVPLEISPNPEKRLKSYFQTSPILQKIMDKFEESLTRELRKVNAVDVTLDPETAHPKLILTQDLKSVRKRAKGEMKKQHLPCCSERFDSMLCVLGRERFTSGIHCWEVTVKAKSGCRMWAIGIAKQSVERKRYISIDPKEGIWAVGKATSELLLLDGFRAFTSSQYTLLTLKQEPTKIWVFLDYEKHCVEFFDAATDDLIYRFRSATFSGEEIRPFFFVSSRVELHCSPNPSERR